MGCQGGSVVNPKQIASLHSESTGDKKGLKFCSMSERITFLTSIILVLVI